MEDMENSWMLKASMPAMGPLPWGAKWPNGRDFRKTASLKGWRMWLRFRRSERQVREEIVPRWQGGENPGPYMGWDHRHYVPQAPDFIIKCQKGANVMCVCQREHCWGHYYRGQWRTTQGHRCQLVAPSVTILRSKDIEVACVATACPGEGWNSENYSKELR